MAVVRIEIVDEGKVAWKQYYVNPENIDPLMKKQALKMAIDLVADQMKRFVEDEV